MKFAKLSLIFSTVILSLTTIPFAVKAETISSQIAQVPSPVPKKGYGKINSLGLTDAQKAQIAAIRRQAQAQIEAILTPQQLEQLKTARQNRQIKHQVWQNLNLTEEQKNRIREIRQAQKSQIEAILTPEQKQQLQQLRQNMRSHR
jgi:Spy/CpxP family protein refolding chaperone